MAHNESIATEVIAASIGGAVSASVLYPLEVLKTKMQSETKSTTTTSGGTTGTKTTKIPNGGGTARGEKEKEEDGKEVGSAKTATEEEASNKAAAAEKPPPPTAITTTQQQPPPKSHTMISYAQSMYQTGGIRCFYSGIETSAIQSATEKGLYFLAYTALKNVYNGVLMGGGGDIGTLPNLVLGCMAEWAHLPITLPIDCLTTKIQTDTTGQGAFALMSSMLSEKGIGGMYKGIQAYTILCLKPAIQYTVFEQVKRIVLSSRQKQRNQLGLRNRKGGGNDNNETLSAMEAFLLGMIARTIATVVVFPYLRAKVMLQSTTSASSSSSNKPSSIPGMLKEIYTDGGINELFRGLGPELTRGVLSAALMLMIKEKIGIWVKEQFVVSSNSNKQRR